MCDQHTLLLLKSIRTFSICTALFCFVYYFIMLLPRNVNLVSTAFLGDLIQFDADEVNDANASLIRLRNVVNLCQKFPPVLLGLFNITIILTNETVVSYANSNIRPGGRFTPGECRARQNVALIIPFRNRTDHLNMFLSNVHPFLQRQQLAYTIFVVEQDGKVIFNKGKLMNIGFVEASKSDNFDCFVFHDTDLIPENDHNLYSCSSQPTLLAVSINIFKYKPMYWNHFGGAISITKDQFTAVNGYPNLYWGWGHEDDDLSERIREQFRTIPRRHRDIGRYTMIQHEKDGLNPKNDLAYHLAKSALSRARTDGLSNLRYRVVRFEKRPLYTWILVDVGRPPKLIRLRDGTFAFMEN